MAAEDISPLKDGGVLKEILTEGCGDEVPSTGSKVTVHYTGTLLDGTKFDSSKDRDNPFQFTLGQGQVIKAWDIGIATMKKGEVAMLTCDSKYAYGKMGSPPKIPADATLKFEVEMIDFTGEDLSPDDDGSIQRFQIETGKSGGYPSDGSVVDIHLIGKYNDKVFEERDVQFTLGEGEEFGIIEGVERALEKFSSGEKSRLKIKSKFAFKSEGKAEFGIPADADVEYTIQLNNFEKVAEPWSMEGPEKVAQAKLFKEKATNYFKSSKYQLAIKMCQKAVKYLEHEDGFEDDLKTERNELILSVHLNLALFYLKTEQNIEAKAECDKALEIDPNNEKALFRRGQAQFALASPETAVKDFEAVLKVEPKNVAAAKQISVCNTLIKQNIAREKKLYANMFDKFAQADKQ
ncbi:FK506-binding protein 59 isoform X2 [Venturia canescens]|nr:FK506-binding protein 59-like isoform X2 [Venturia canescens]